MKSIKEHQYFGFWVHCSGEREGERERGREIHLCSYYAYINWSTDTGWNSWKHMSK